MAKPITKFTNVDEIAETAQYYIELLGLEDWRFAFALSDETQGNNMGQTEYQFVNKLAVITIHQTAVETIFGYSDEQTLIHELLHCKISMFDDKPHLSLQEQFFATCQHQLIEDMARAIYQARYGDDAKS